MESALEILFETSFGFQRLAFPKPIGLKNAVYKGGKWVTHRTVAKYTNWRQLIQSQFEKIFYYMAMFWLICFEQYF